MSVGLFSAIDFGAGGIGMGTHFHNQLSNELKTTIYGGFDVGVSSPLILS